MDWQRTRRDGDGRKTTAIERGGEVGGGVDGAGGGAAAPPAQAQFAVIDVAAIRHLVVQIDYWRQQIEAIARN